MVNPPEAGPEVGEKKAIQSDKQLRRALNQWDIAFLVVGAMIGSGWLFGSLGAAATAGPAAILSWLIAGFLMIFIALAYAEIGGMLPKSGGIVRYPQYTHGGFASFIMGWAYFLSAVTVAPSEAIAAVTYMSSYLPQLMSNGLLTPLGTLVAAALVVFFFLLNWYGVHVMGKTNTAVGWWKLIIPSLTFILLMALAMHTVNYSGLAGGFIPYGWSEVFLAIPTTGIAYAYLGFRQGIDYSGEARKATDVVWGTILGYVIVMFIYVMLQVAFIGAVNWSAAKVSPGNWQALSSSVLSSGPFYEIMATSGVAILAGFAVILLIDAIISPSGTGWIYIGTTARTIYGMAADGHLPSAFLKLNRHKIPLWPTIAALVLGLLFLLPFPTWFAISSFITTTTVFTYIIGGPSLMTLRRTAPNANRPIKLPAASVIGAIATIAAFLIVYWSTFYYLWFAIALILAGLPLFYMYTMVNRYGASRTAGIVSGIIYWVVLIVATYYLIYLPFAAPTGWPASLPVTMLKLQPTHIVDFVSYVVVMIAMVVGFTLYVASTARDREIAMKHVKAGWWVVATIFSAFILSFLGSFSVFETPIIPFPWDTIIAALVALGLYLYGSYSGILTEDLVVALRELGGV
ncbi:APC family permease [Vulcanisaeta distributa]|uniref:Amino acid permease-associated region n=1 Tax=Vulcanisaeta distributa (strain DSM 14429 / JCM 11212 / NBRC 100878 / IC-017) TaxID=572478 RepID=E1QS84_VULDI|nr:APC family permease [Vulcanisaeta distributa]ADN49477.1 amino acid permease-associated region [Vulcanisaeta distributa DSM 14429]